MAGQDAISALAVLLDEAQGRMREHRRGLRAILSRLRAAHRSHLERLQVVEEDLAAVQQGLARAGAGEEPPIRSWSIPVLWLQEQAEALRQEQAWLVEHLLLLAAAARRISAVERQAELGASYLRGDLSQGGGAEELSELAQVHALQAQEDERRRLAREIHDGPAQVLVNAITELEHFRRILHSHPESAETTFERLELDLRSSLGEVRQFVHDLQPGPVVDLGLVVALQSYLDEYARRTGLRVHLDAEPRLERLTMAVEQGIFRIIQEALQNVRKHGQARAVTVTLGRIDGTLRVLIQDDGVGFEPAKKREERGHFGLASMADRADLLRGELRIESIPGAGTLVTLLVPIDEDLAELPPEA